MRSTYRYFLLDNVDTTAGDLVERILGKCMERAEVKEKAKNFSIFLINTKIVEAHLASSKSKSVPILADNSDFDTIFESASSFPKVMKRKLNSFDKPIQILQRTNRRLGLKDPEEFQWDLYFLRNSSKTMIKRNTAVSTNQREGAIFEQLKNNITDKKFFHRKGN